MIAQPKEKNIDLWEAWIDLLSTQANAGTLYIIGDVLMSSDLVPPYFIKKRNPLNDPGVLALEIVAGKVYDEAYVTEIFYSEDLKNINQYYAINIYEGNELVKTIEEIEKVY